MNNSSLNLDMINNTPTLSEIIKDLNILKTLVPNTFNSIDDISKFIDINEFGWCAFDNILDKIDCAIRINMIHEHEPMRNEILKGCYNFIGNIIDNMKQLRAVPNHYYDTLVNNLKDISSTEFKKEENLDEMDKLQKLRLETYKTNLLIYNANKIRQYFIKDIIYSEISLNKIKNKSENSICY